MIYDIAGLRIQIKNMRPYTTKFCRDYLSEDQESEADLTASVTEEEFKEEKAQSPQFHDGYIENICLYRSICMQLPTVNRFLLHASILEYDGKAYAFLGKSGTGKSTHTKLWLKFLPDARVLNGDKPILEFANKEFYAHGTPWQGKENWGYNGRAKLFGLCFLEQAKENSVEKLSISETSARIFQQILLPQDENNVIATLDLIDKLVATVPAYLLKCNISEEAVRCSFQALTKKEYLSNKNNEE